MAEFQSVDADAAKVWILNGEPAERYPIDCGLAFWPIEIWYYRATQRMARAVTVIFYRPAAGPVLRIWHPQDGTDVLMAFPTLDKPTKAPLNDERGDGLPTDAGINFVQLHTALLPERRGVDAPHQGGARGAELRPHRPPAGGGAARARSRVAWPISPPARPTRRAAAEPLSEAELRWLDDVAVLITAEERRIFMALPRAYQRAGFVEAFWKARDLNPKTPENEARAIFEARVETARERWRSITVDQARIYLLNGEPARDDEDRLQPEPLAARDLALRLLRPLAPSVRPALLPGRRHGLVPPLAHRRGLRGPPASAYRRGRHREPQPATRPRPQRRLRALLPTPAHRVVPPRSGPDHRRHAQARAGRPHARRGGRADAAAGRPGVAGELPRLLHRARRRRGAPRRRAARRLPRPPPEPHAGTRHGAGAGRRGEHAAGARLRS